MRKIESVYGESDHATVKNIWCFSKSEYWN